MKLSKTTFLGQVDHSILRPETTVIEAVAEAVRLAELGVFSVCVKPNQVFAVSQALAGTATHTTTVVSFPHGNSSVGTKEVEGLRALNSGAVELDVVADYSAFLSGDEELMAQEVTNLVYFAKQMKFRRSGVIVKVILETGYFTARQLRVVAALFQNTPEIDFLKTSTGFAPTGGATVKSVRILKEYSGGKAIKASGGVGSLADAEKFIEAGATRLGCSKTEAVVNEILAG